MNKPHISRKLYITLILILFLLPFLSWYYLQQGLNWRKKAQEIMNGTEPFPKGDWVDHFGQKLSSDQLENHVTLITLMPCDTRTEMQNLLDDFYDKFNETDKANFIILDTCSSQLSGMSPNKRSWYVFSCLDSLPFCPSVNTSWPTGKSHALVDKHPIIRSYYSTHTDDEKRILLEHMALLIPRDRSEKVELKRQDGE